MKNLILLKLGGSLITNKQKPYTEKKAVIEDLTVQIKRALIKRQDLALIIGNGGGSYAHYPAAKYNLQNGLPDSKNLIGFCEVESGAGRLNRIIVDSLISQNIPAISIDPSSVIKTRKGEIVTFFTETLVAALKLGIIPVVYGDIVFDEVQGAAIVSTEKLLAYLARFLASSYRIEKIIHNGITQGVLDLKGNLIPHINTENWASLQSIFTQTQGYDVTGGMLHKVKESLVLAQEGFPSLIINSFADQDILFKALCGLAVTGTQID
jgi:isopentenyl phosphate kinase